MKVATTPNVAHTAVPTGVLAHCAVRARRCEAHETALRSGDGATGLGTAEQMASIDRQLQILENADGVDPEQLKTVAWDLAEQQIMLGADVDALPDLRKSVSNKLVRFQNRLTALQGVN